MKALLTIFTLGCILFFNACKTDDPVSPGQSSNTASGLNAAEQALVGRWILDQRLDYTASTGDTTVNNYSSPSTCYLELTGTPSASQYPRGYTGSNAMSCNGSFTVTWSADTSRLSMGMASYTIEHLSAVNLVLYEIPVGGNGDVWTRYYFHK